MEDRMAQSAQTGAFTLMLLVKNYRSQMIALLLKNGVAVPSGASDKQIIDMMANLLKISKYFYKDIMLFLQNPKVINNLAGEFSQNAQYFRADGFMNYQGNKYGFDDVSFKPDDTEDETPKTPKKGGFWSNLNLGDLLTKGVDTLVALDKNKTDRAIADARKGAGLPPLTEEEEEIEEKKKKNPDDEKMSTTTIVVLSLVGIAVIGTIIYFVTRPKKV